MNTVKIHSKNGVTYALSNAYSSEFTSPNSQILIKLDLKQEKTVSKLASLDHKLLYTF